jgi:hypothetical protein
MTPAQQRKIKQTGCDMRFDNLTRSKETVASSDIIASFY